MARKKYTEEEIRENWDGALSVLPYGEIARTIEWGFYREDLETLMELHRSGKHRKKIEDLLEDCNFHYECGNWHNGNYVILEE